MPHSYVFPNKTLKIRNHLINSSQGNIWSVFPSRTVAEIPFSLICVKLLKTTAQGQITETYYVPKRKNYSFKFDENEFV